MNNISFQGKTELMLNPKAYSRLDQVINGQRAHLRKNTQYKLLSGKTMSYETGAESMVVVLKNEKTGILKSIPRYNELDDVITELSENLRTLQRTAKENITAWIIGGDRISKDAQTTNVLNKIADLLCDRPDIDTSILVGSKSGEERIILHTLHDKLEILLDKNLKNKSHSSAEEVMEEFFDIVELNNTKLADC